MPTPPRLSDATLPQAREGVARPAYDREATRTGVVHFGPGAFHRAHQAWYFDHMLAADPGFGICEVALRSGGLAAALRPQDGLYLLVEQAASPRYRVIGAITELIHAPEAPASVLARLLDPEVRLVTATVTEKGYGLAADGTLDLEHPDIRHDLAAEGAPLSLVGWVTAGLAGRRTAGLAPFAVVSCDNLSGNGRKLRAACVRFARARGDEDLAAWIEAAVPFPDTMVDSITPATDEALRAQVADAVGLTDAWPVQREPFAQWVIEDLAGLPRESLAAAGATLTSDVAAFERAKLRLLNGAHSTLAYAGLARGHETVAQAMADPWLAGQVEAMMREAIAPSLTPAPGLDLAAYIPAILQRFRNPAIVHRLSQIAWDGSQKLPIRLLATASEALAAGRPVDRLALGPAAWMRFVCERTRSGGELIDPLADRLRELARACDGGPADVARFLTLEAVFPRDLAADPRFRAALERAYLGH